MLYQDLKKTLKNKIDNLYLLFGEDGYLIKNSLKLIKDALNIQMEEINYSSYIDCDIDFEKIVRELETMPAFSDKKLIFIDLSTKNSKISNEKHLKSYCDNPNKSSVLVVNIGLNEKIDKKMFSSFTNVDCSRLSDLILEQFIVFNIKKFGKKITNEALKKLIEFTLGDILSILSEINKIVGFIGDREEIVLDDILQNVSKSIEFQIYELTENLGRKNIKGSLEIVEQIKMGKKAIGKSDNSNGLKGLLPLIYNHFRRLFFISLNSYSKSEYAKYLKIHEFAVSKCLNQVKFFGVKKLKSILDFCAKLDFEIKESKTNEVNAIEILVLYIIGI